MKANWYNRNASAIRKDPNSCEVKIASRAAKFLPDPEIIHPEESVIEIWLSKGLRPNACQAMAPKHLSFGADA